MKQLLMKEIRLTMHPTNLIFLALSAMLLIPDYPYYVTFFYTTLGLFFTCLNAREMHDIEYSMTLPVRKRDVVRGRMLLAAAVEGVQVLLAIPFAAIRQRMPLPGNSVGMDANIAFFGLALGMLGLFNLLFFPMYFRHPEKIGGAFLLASAAEFLYMGVAEALTHVVPFFRDRLDTPDPLFLGEKLAALLGGLALYALMTAIACKSAEKRFETVDL